MTATSRPITGSVSQPAGWGYAPTPMSAAATVASFSPQRRPVVVLSPQPQHPPRWATFSPDESDLSEHGQPVGDLLAVRGPIYAEHVGP
jgi:hypothetical protein